MPIKLPSNLPAYDVLSHEGVMVMDEDAAARQERYFFDNNQYSSTLTALGYGAATVTSAEGAYTMGAPAAGPTGAVATSFQLTATPTFSDTDCGNLILDSRGTKSISASNDATIIDRCWGR